MKRKAIEMWYFLENYSEWSKMDSSVQLLSRVQLFATPWIAACQASLSITNSRSSPKLMCIHGIGDAIQPSHPLLSPSPPAPNPSQHQSLFQWVSSSHEVAKVLEFQPWHQSFQRTPSFRWSSVRIGHGWDKNWKGQLRLFEIIVSVSMNL